MSACDLPQRLEVSDLGLGECEAHDGQVAWGRLESRWEDRDVATHDGRPQESPTVS